MAKQLNVNLAFTADTGKAKAQIQELQNLLSQITYSGATSKIGDKISIDLQKASTAAKELQFHLNNAFNTTTGKFDLSLLDRSLKTSGANITQLSTQLLGAGATGQQAFLKLAQSISLADQPMLRVSNRMREFGTVMKNTIKWQLSSSMIHGFMGAINSAYGYAQDLNKSLTDIRIVTGDSADEMARFAEQANKTAKTLSTTTNDYAKASLIYFQQGLDDAEVQKRTDVTIKMANATGTSAQTVSDQMTAVWNNFDDGSKSLEYYADVMTALGAATASSTDEISQGLQKFAAVAETVGLSYEYATAALTAIMSNTRESADVVGTALKTLFARIQGLKLGETLEDGVDLNKYSAALKSVGISIFESNGELKAMDNILNEMAAKWDTLNNAQQTALAQTVAGVRQYTQLIALMENWDNGDADSFQANLKTISGAEGTLDEQAEIYAQSWEAAEKRVRASAEGIYQSLLDDKFFISLNNGFANVLTGIDSFIDGLGGVKPLITGIASIFISNFAHKIPQVLDNLKYNLQILTKSTKDVYDKMASDIYKVSNTQFQAYKDTNERQGINEDSSLGVALKQANDLTAARTKLALVTDKMSESERQMANTSLSIIQQTQDEVLALTKKKEVLEKNIELQMKSAQSSAGYFNSYDLGETQAHKLENKVDINALGLQNFDGMSNLGGSIAANLSQNLFQVIDEANNKARSIGTTWEQVANTTNEKITSIKTALGTEFEVAVENIKTKLSSVNQEDFGNVKKQLLNFLQVLPSGVRDIDAVQKALHNLRDSKGPAELVKNFKALDDVLAGIKPNLTHSEKILSSIHGDKIHTLVGSMKDYNSTINEANSKTNILKTMLQEFQPTHVVRMSEAFGALGGMMGNVVTIGRSIKSAFDALSNPDLSGWEKFSTVLMSISMIIPGVLSMLRNIATLSSFCTTLINQENAALTKQAILQSLNTAAASTAYKSRVTDIQKVLVAMSAENKEKMASILADGALAASTGKLTQAKKEELIAQLASIIAGEKEVNTSHKEIAAKILEAHANKAVETTLWGIAKARLAAMPLSAKIILAVVAAIAAAVAIFKALNTSQKEANEAIEKANKKYEEEKQKLEELENELQQVNDRIKELNSQDQLDIVDQAELDKLEARKALLESQVALQEKLAKISLGEKAEEISKNWDATTKPTDIPNENGVVKQTGYEITYTDNASHVIPVYTSVHQNLEEYKNSVGYNSETGRLDPSKGYSEQEEAEIIAKIEAWTAENEAQWDQWRQDNASQYEKIEANYSAVVDAIDAGAYTWKPEEKEQAQNDLAEWRKAMYGEDYDDNFIKPVLDAAENLTVQKDEETGQYTVSGLDQKTMDYYGINQGQIDSWINEKIAANPEAYSKLEGMDLSKLSSDQLFLLFDNLDQLEHFEGKSIEELIAYLNKIEDIKPPEFNTEEWKKDYSDKMKIINDLETGDSISAEDYALLGEEYQQYFQVQADGTAILIAKAEELKAKAQEIEIGKLKEEISSKQNIINDLESSEIDYTYLYNGLKYGRTTDFQDLHEKAGSETGFNETENGQEISYIEAINHALSKNYKTAEEAYAGYEAFKASLSDEQGVAATTANSLNKLNEMLQNNLITLEDYNNSLKGTLYKEAESEGIDLDELQEYANYIEEIGEVSEETALKIALAEKKQAKGADDLIDNYKDYAKVLKEAELDSRIKDTEKYSKVIKKLKKDLSLLTGFEEEIFTDKFINSDEVQKALLDISNGVDGATEKLKVLATAQEIKVKAGVEVDDSTLDNLWAEITNLNNQNIEIGATIDEAPALDSLVNLLQQAGYTTSEIQNLFNKLGWQPEVGYEEVQVKDLSTHESNGYVEVVEGNPYEGYRVVSKPVSAFSGMNQEEWVKVPKIGSKSAGGGGYKKVDPIGNSSTKTPSKGGGGGGGSKKHAEKKSSSDRTRYHTLQNQLEDLSAEYDEISEAADRAFGQEKLDNIDAQIKKTDELIDKQEEYLDAISQNLPIDKNVMTAYYDDVIGGPAMKFDEKGNISNYDAIEKAMFNKYNSMADKYTDDSTEWQVFEKKYEQLEKYIKQYEETYDLLRDEETAYQELLNQRVDLELEKVQYKIELELDVPESEIAKLEYQIGRIEDDAYESAEAVQLLTKQAEAVYDQIQVNKQGLNDIIKISKNFNTDTLTEEQADLIKEYRDNLLDLNEEFDDIRATIEEKVMETFDSFNEKLQTNVDVFDHYNSVLESYKNIVDIVGEDRLGISDQFMNGLNQASIDSAIEQLKATDTAMKVIQDAQAQAEVALAEAKARGDEASQRMWEETLSSLNEEAQSAQEEMLSAWENALDAIAETFEATVERVVKTFNDSIYALGGLEGLQDDFSRQQENADIMLDDYQKIYELSKLSRDINKTIDDTDIIGGKQKLKKLLGEINKLQEDGVEMSQYDLEYLQKTYDLRLAELELEEAQRAKNTVRLSRDNEGNWSYIYTQNTDAVDAAQQKYEDALYAMQDLSSNYIDEMSEQLISTSQEMAEALAAIRIQDYANINDYYAEVERVQSQYQEELAMQEEELQKAIDNNKVLYDTDWTNYHNATGYKISDTELFATTFRDTLLGALIGSEEDSANFTDIMGAAVSDLTNNLMAGAEIYYTNLENAMNAAGTSTGDFAEDTAANIDAVVEKSKEGAAAVDQMAIEMQTAMENIMDSVTNWQEAYGMAMENIIQSNLEVIESFNQMLAALSIDADSITVKYDIADVAGGQAQQFDTGGYTGEWGKGGKLAVLHEKELILKPEDTSNFLTAVQITRAMLETIDLNAKQASFGLGNLVPSTIKDDNNQTLEQQVHIVAEFPNVNDHNEIEQAFNNLINTASQYANRK